MLFRSLLAVCMLALPLSGFAQDFPGITIDELGKGMAELSGPWRFHIGDNPAWADPKLDDLPGKDGWETIDTDRPWGAQNHYAYVGFAWYRVNLRYTTAAGVKDGVQLVLPRIQDVCEIYWNGKLIGTYGKFPPRPSWPVLNAPAVFPFAGPSSGVLAIRVWMDRLGTSSPGDGGGIGKAPLLGDDASVAAYVGTWNYDFLRSRLWDNFSNALYLAVALAGLGAWLRHRKETLLLWLSIFAACPAIWTSLYTMRFPISSQSSSLLSEPMWTLRNAALWFLLLDLFRLKDRPRLVRWAKIFATVTIVGGFLDGCLAWVPTNWMSFSTGALMDEMLTVVIEPPQLFLLVLVAYGLRQKLDSVRWTIGISASLSALLSLVATTSRQGQRYTHWTLAQTLYTPLLHIGPVYITAQTILDLLLFFSILYAVYRYIRDQQQRKAVLERELHSARELQHVLIPEKIPPLPGYSVSSAYLPALDVGGDFFQIIPLEGAATGSTLVVLGDVSGKGLRAAMAVSLIVGAVRTLVETTSSPAEILAGISRRLFGRMQGGFSTCIVLCMYADGSCILASAGHPAPYLNDQEISLPGALPLGIDPATAYEERTVYLRPGDRFALYTDGLLEARSSAGEIFSFERLQSLFASRVDAAQATEAAVAFGQEDDITVLTLTRLATA